MATAGHVLTATDAAIKAFFDAAAITNLPAASIVTGKFYLTKTLPVLICAASRAERARAKNWTVTGSLILRSDVIDDATGDVSADQCTAVTTMETAVLDALEAQIPNDDRPQPLADAITAAAVAGAVVLATDFLMTGFMIQSVNAGFNEEIGLWEFTVDYSATVIA